MRLTAATLLGLLLVARIGSAQTVDDVQISVGAFELAATGAEKPSGVWRGTGPLRLDTTTVGLFSVRGCGAFTLTVPPNAFEQNATVGWRVEVTPIRVVDHTVTFRLSWVRTPGMNAGLAAKSEDMTVTLRPGESRPVDTVMVDRSRATSIDGGPCRTEAVSLRVLVDFPELDRRLVGADVWLIERLADGKEQSQLQAVRGLPHSQLPFYFDSVIEGTARLDMFGHLTAAFEGESLKVDLQVVRAGAHPGQSGYQSARWFRSTLSVTPGETVEVALPRPDEGFDAFTNRTFALRIRAKQIR